MSTVLEWRSYRYFDYERDFARREVAQLFGVEPGESDSGLVVNTQRPPNGELNRLTYFSRAVLPGGVEVVPLQARLERSAHPQRRERQSTRYSAHGLHEYKGKFNPQVVRAIGNILGVAADSWVLDPFCGSGTTLLEAAHAGWNALGIDRNPLAVHIANAKLRALRLGHGPLERYAASLVEGITPWLDELAHDEDISGHELDQALGAGWTAELVGYDYLVEWFPKGVLAQWCLLKRLLSKVVAGEDRAVFEVIVSDQLREASWQEPADLRIRRRKQPAANYPLLSMVMKAIHKIVPRISAARAELGKVPGWQQAVLADTRSIEARGHVPGGRRFDAVITSPPYATALPYIDTQRLSLVLLGLIPAAEIRSTEAALVGARDIATSERRLLAEEMLSRPSPLVTQEVVDLCREMHVAASLPGNGFRRQHKPALVYRYFRDMAAALEALRASLVPEAPVALVVGSNRTTLGGRDFVIDTPAILARVGEHVGFHIDRLLPMNTYPRYDLHQQNSINEETLVVLRA